MNLKRVKEIIRSEDELNVQFHGVPVWIESIDEVSGLAMVSARGNHDHSRLVSINALDEE